ncbi:MAG: YbcC family protein [Saprospiraceae bacterium]
MTHHTLLEAVPQQARGFDENHVLHELKHFLPTQTPLKDFIHHNSLHAFQSLTFYDAIFKASKIFGFKVTFNLAEYRGLHRIGRIREDILDKVITDRKGAANLADWKEKVLHQGYDETNRPRIGQLRANWKTAYRIDLDNLVQPLLFRILGSYLDQGIALWHFPFEDKGLLNAVRELERASFSSFFKSKRVRNLLLDKENCTISQLLNLVVGDEAFFEQYLFDQQFSHRGWSGMAAALEAQPNVNLYPKKIELRDLIILELLLEIDALDGHLGKGWQPLCQKIKPQPTDLFADLEPTELHDVYRIWQDAFEWSYYDEVLAGLRQLKIGRAKLARTHKHFQAIFCIDEREDSLRRHLEAMDKDCETLGSPGFFGVEFYFQPENGKFYEKLCPAPVTPKYLIKESGTNSHRQHELLYTKKSHTLLWGLLGTLSLGIVAAAKLFLTVFRPKMSPAISNAFAHMNVDGQLTIENKSPEDRENDLQIGFTVEEMAARVGGLLRGIGMVEDFSPLVYVVAHGSSSANNPHHGAHDCGACSGRPGSVNARVFAMMANHPRVREILAAKGLSIPTDTQFIGALHDTAADEIAFYEEHILSEKNATAHRKNKDTFERALDLNAQERSRRFASINTKADIRNVREAIRRRSVSLFEPRPELGHGTNALCFVGHRELTKGLFLDRRAFMNSYDHRTDPEGKLLLGVMRPLPVVCGGINLEYYFSRLDNYKLGAGTKLPHNVMGLIGVANSSDGDLRPGLPLQMIEVHDPVRLLILVEHRPEVVLKTIQTEPAVYEWFENGWVHLVAIDPDTDQFFYFKNGKFEHYVPLAKQVCSADDMNKLIKTAKEMDTNFILDATQENLPVHVME